VRPCRALCCVGSTCNADLKCRAGTCVEQAGDAASESALDVFADVVKDEGTCRDTSTSPSNCGRCGHSCQGGACVGGVCQPVVLASGQSSPADLAVDSTSVFWADFVNPGAVYKVSIGGGAITTLSSGDNSPNRVALSGKNLYWADTGGIPSTSGKIQVAPTAGGTVTTLASGQDTPVGIAVSDTNIYWGSYSDGTVISALLDGGSLSTIASAREWSCVSS
jgi:hypothetical protein